MAQEHESDEKYDRLGVVLRYLIEKGADLNLIDGVTNACTPLQLAASSGRMRVVRMLLDLGADVNGPPGSDGFTLH